MLYPLSSVHKLVYEIIHPESLLKPQQEGSLPDIWTHLHQEIEDSRLHLFSQLSQANGTDALKVIVYTCQAGYVSLINRLSHYIVQAGRTEDMPALFFRYTQVRRTLIHHLTDLYEHYAPFFDPEQYVPKFIANTKHRKIKKQLSILRKQLVSLCADESLVSLVFFPFEQLIEYGWASVTYKQLHYIGLFLTELTVYCSTAGTCSHILPLPDFLIQMNFNEPRFIDYLTGQLREQVTDDMSLHEQAEKWAFHVKEFHRLGAVTPFCLHPQRQPVKESLINAAEQELQFIKQKISLLPVVGSALLPHQKERASIVTHLTVSQLGVFTRLLVDCKLIHHQNQTELLKLIAQCLTTTKTAQISAESLRVRYYNPDRASLAITKEYLMQMIQQLNKY